MPKSQLNTTIRPFDQVLLSPDSAAAARANSGRKVLLLLGVALFGSMTGLALVHLPPLLVVGALVAVTSIVGVLMQPYIGLLFYTVIFLLRPAELYPALASLHLERIVGTVTLVGWVLEQVRHERRLLVDGTRQTHLLLLFLLAVLLSIPFAYWRKLAVDGFIETLRIGAFYLMVVHLVNTRTRLRYFVWTLTLLTAYLAITSLQFYFEGGSRFLQGIDRAVGRTSAGGDANQLGTTLACSFPLFLLLACTKSMGWRRLPFAIGAGVLVVTMAITGSRASLLGFSGGLLCVWWLSPRRLFTAFIGIFLLIVCVQVLPEQYRRRYSTLTSDDLDASSQSRLEAWQAGVRMVVDRPITGVGIRCFGVAHGTNYSPESARNWLQAHSLYVQVASELGLVGAAVFLRLLLEMLRVNRRASHQVKESWSDWEFELKILDALLAGFVVLLISGMFGHSLLRRTWYVYAAMGLAVLRLCLDARVPAADSLSIPAVPRALLGARDPQDA